MRVTFAPKGILQIDDARIIFKNFSGTPGQFNREGERSFHVVIPDEEIADELVERGWNVKVKPPREEGEAPLMSLKVKVKFNDRGPHCHLVSGNSRTKLDQNTIACLDKIYISSVDMDIRPYDWDVSGKSGRTAYLQSIRVVQDIRDRFAEEEYPEE